MSIAGNKQLFYAFSKHKTTFFFLNIDAAKDHWSDLLEIRTREAMKILFFFVVLASANADHYDTISGKKISKSTYKERKNISK